MDQMAVQNEKFPRPKNIAQMSSSALRGYLCKGRDLLTSKMDEKQLPLKFFTTFRSKEGAVEKLQGICDEQRRT